MQDIEPFSNSCLTLDSYLDTRIKLGQAQMRQFWVLSFVDFMDGFAFVFLSILLSLLKSEWNLTQMQVIVLGSVYYLGVAIGMLCQGIYSDIYGRKKLLTLTMGLLILTLFAHIFIQNYFHVVLLRFTFGIEFGVKIINKNKTSI